MRITLVLAASPDDPLRQTDPFMPLSLPLLATAAPEHDYTLVDMLAGEEPDLDAPVDLVGISLRRTAERAAFGLADAWRARGVTVVLGGAQASSAPERAAEHADAVVVGEGEAVWPVLLRHHQEGRLRRFYLGSPRPLDLPEGQVHQVEDWLDLSTVPRASRGLYSKRYPFDTVFSSRGCAMGCEFCAVGPLFGQATRLRPVQEVVDEISTFRGYYYLLDDTVFGRPSTWDHYEALYAAIAELRPIRYWTGQANLDAAASPRGREIVRAAARAGLIYAAVGLESVQPAVLDQTRTLRKHGARHPGEALERMREHIAFLQSQGIALSGWFTLGHEEDFLDTFRATLDFCRDNHLLPVLSPLVALPGTPLWARLEAEGRLDTGRRLNLVHPSLSEADILGALEEVARLAWSPAEILRRTLFYARRMGSRHEADREARARIEKTTFVAVLQARMRKGVVGLVSP